jgi:Ring finger domain
LILRTKIFSSDCETDKKVDDHTVSNDGVPCKPISCPSSPGEDLISHKDKTSRNGGASEHDCAICFHAILHGDRVGALNGCAHVFHVACLKRWLQRKNVCPLCQARNVAQPFFDPIALAGAEPPVASPTAERSVQSSRVRT